MTRLSIAIAVAAALVGCQKVTTLEVTPASISLDAAGKSQVLAVRVLDQNAKPMDGLQLNYISTKPEVATVDASGKVTAVKSGDAAIQVKVGEKMSEVAVNVVIPATLTVTPSPVAITGVAVTAELKAEIADDAGRPIPGAAAAFASADEAIAKVAGNIVTSAAPGATKIKATFGALAQEVDLTVAMPEFASVAVEPPAPAAKVGEAVQLTATAKNAEGAAVSGVPFAFASSDEKIATVDATGKVTTVAAGKATITVTAGDKTATAKVTVAK